MNEPMTGREHIAMFAGLAYGFVAGILVCWLVSGGGIR